MATTLTPEVLWAQRSSTTEPAKNHIYMTISAPDVAKEDMKLDLKPTGLTFTGYSQTRKVNYHLELELYGEIDPAESRVNHTGKNVEMVLRKKELKEEYWPRLLKEAKKLHFVKTDFDKWVDEDEQEDVKEDDDYMSRMGPAMGGAGGPPGGDFGGIDFSKLGGAGGMPDLGAMAGMGGMGGMGGMPGMGGMGGMGGEDDDDDDVSDDEDMPELEDEEGVKKTETGGPSASVDAAKGETGASATKTGAKIEEVE